MTDFIAKARAGRIIAINAHNSGAVMFFPEDIVETKVERRQIVATMVKPMFVRSAALHPSGQVKAPPMDQVANAQPYVLTDEHAVTALPRAA